MAALYNGKKLMRFMHNGSVYRRTPADRWMKQTGRDYVFSHCVSNRVIDVVESF